MILVTPEQMKASEAKADENGISYRELMERAGIALSAKIAETIEEKHCEKVLFLCGNGNNAGDCFVAARKLSENGTDCVVLLLCGMPKTALSKETFERISHVTTVCEHQAAVKLLQTNSFSVIVDGVFGTGFHGMLPENVSDLFNLARQQNKDAEVIAVDVPSGGNCKTGVVSEGTMKADITITFAFEKFGMSQYPLREYCGRIEIADIGIEERFSDDFDLKIRPIDHSYAKTVIPRKCVYSHKGNYGKLLIVCGSDPMPGACVMSVEAALKSGAGLIETATTRSTAAVIAARAPEVMLCFMDADEGGFISESNYDKIMELSEKATAVLIGCGIGTIESTKNLVKRLVCDIRCPVILDADGINCISDSIDIIKKSRQGIVLTPHPAEMGRLIGKTAAEVQSDRLSCAVEFARKCGAVVVLKGAGTIVTDGSRVFVNRTGNPGMAKGGSGDVLSGVISSLAAQGTELFDSAAVGVYVHGLAGDLAAEKLCMQSMTATDIIKNLSDAFKTITE